MIYFFINSIYVFKDFMKKHLIVNRCALLTVIQFHTDSCLCLILTIYLIFGAMIF